MTIKATSILLVVAVTLMSYFLAIGYAALVDDMDIEGTVSVEGKPYKGRRTRLWKKY